MAESFAGNYLTDEDGLSVLNGDAGASSATVLLSGNILTLKKDGVPQTLNLEEAEKDTLQELVVAINALGSGWTATLLGVSSRASKNNVVDQAEVNCLGSDNAVILKTLFSDVTNWPAEYETIQKKQLVSDKEEEIERITKDFFYTKAFDLKLDGNGKDRIFLQLFKDILSVSALYVYGIEIDSTLYTFDAHSVFLDTTTVIGSWVEWRILKKELETEVLFPAGDRNVRIVGTYGWSSCPRDIRSCAKILIEDGFDESLYDHWRAGSFSIGGDYSYTNPSRVYTGIMKADRILERYRRKRPLLATTRSMR